MKRPRQVLIVLLLALFQVGLLPLQAQAGTSGEGMEDCACCAPAVHTSCCCGDVDAGASECPCALESPQRERLPLPPVGSGDGPRLPEATVALAAPCASVSTGELVRLDPYRPQLRPVARAGPPLYRLYAVDRR